MKLNVCSDPDFGGWMAYIVINGLAVCVARADFNGLDDLRHYALREGYDGILFGTTSLSWGRITRRDRSFGSPDYEAMV